MRREITVGIVVTVVGGLLLAAILGGWNLLFPASAQLAALPPATGVGSTPTPASAGTSVTNTVTPARVAAVLSVDPLPTTELETGKTYTLSGRLVPASGETVEVFADHATVPVGSGKVAGDGGFAVPVQLTTPGSKVTLTVRATGPDPAAVSKTTTGPYDVYEWRYLAQLPTLSRSKNYASDESWPVGGKTYDHSIAFTWSAAAFGGWSNGDASFNLAAKCAKLTALVGVGDNAPGDKTQWSFTAAAGGREAKSGYVGIFAPKQLELDLHGAPRLNLSVARLNPDERNWQPYEGDAVLAEPRVLCLP